MDEENRVGCYHAGRGGRDGTGLASGGRDGTVEGPGYEISVVTPFHNVDLKFFRAAVDSMLAQTIGFEKIQWIIVVHNCEPQYMPALKEMLGHYPNVILEDHLVMTAKDFDPKKDYGVPPSAYEKLDALRRDAMDFLKEALS